MKFIKQHWILILILVVGIFVRVYDFGNTPYGLNQDETSLGYDAWADMTYGMDRNGDHNPMYAVAWGSGQNMLYNYVVRPFIAIFGLSVIAIRLPMLLFGIVTLVVFYLFVKEIFNKSIALLALFLLATCPWHIMMCRWGLEANFVVPVLMFSAYCFAKALKNGVWFIPAMILTALCMYAYSATLLFLIVFVPAIVLYFLIKRITEVKYILIGTAAFLFVSLPMIIFLIINQFDLEPCRFMGFTIPKMAEMRSVSAIPILYKGNFWKTLSDNIWRFKDLMVTMSDGWGNNVVCHYGAIYKFMLPFALVGAGFLFYHRAHIPLIWFVAATIHSIVINATIQRINVILIPVILLIAIGVRYIADKIKGTIIVFVIIAVLMFVSFAGFYFNDYNDYAHLWFYGGFDEVMEIAFTEAPGTVYCVADMNMPYITALYVLRADPAVLNNAEYHYIGSEFKYYDRFGRFVAGVPECINKGDAYIFKIGDGFPEGMPLWFTLDDCVVIERGRYAVAIVN